MLRKQPYSKWNGLDRLLLRAYQMYEDEMSKDSGVPMWIARSTDPDIQFMIEETVDNAAAALAEWDKKQSEKGNKAKKGVTRIAVAYTANGERLEYGGIKRQQFSKAAIQEKQDREEGIELERERPEGGYDPAKYGDGLTTLP